MAARSASRSCSIPSDQVGLPLLVPLFDQAAGLVGSNGRYRSSAMRRRITGTRRMSRGARNAGGAGRSLPPSGTKPAVLPASDLTHFEGFGEQPEFGEKPPETRGYADRRTPRRGSLASMASGRGSPRDPSNLAAPRRETGIGSIGCSGSAVIGRAWSKHYLSPAMATRYPAAPPGEPPRGGRVPPPRAPLRRRSRSSGAAWQLT